MKKNSKIQDEKPGRGRKQRGQDPLAEWRRGDALEEGDGGILVLASVKNKGRTLGGRPKNSWKRVERNPLVEGPR